MDRNPKVLLVDDSPTQLLITQMTLAKEGFEVITAQDGVDGVSKAFADKPDLIISDIVMPELNGYQLCRLLKNDRATARIPIILLTSLDQQLDRFWGLKAGADRYVLKGSPSELLIAQARALLEASRAESPVAPSRPSALDDAARNSVPSRVNYLLDKLLLESTISQETLKLVDSVDNCDQLIQEYIALVGSLIDYSCLILMIVGRDEALLTVDVREPVCSQTAMSRQDEVIQLAKSLSPDVAIICSNLGEEMVKEGGGPDFQSELSVPLRIGTEQLGSINVYSLKPRAFSHAIEATINLLAKDFTMVVKLALLYDENRRLSITDGLTRVYNHRYFREYLEKSFAAATRYCRPLSLILLDIDHFKLLNDTYGHQQGDVILSELAKLLLGNTRKADIVARYGGEEFATVVPETGIITATNVAEKLRRMVDEFPFPGQSQPLHVTISLGVAASSVDTTTSAELIRLADRALYAAKANGRNRVETAPSSRSR